MKKEDDYGLNEIAKEITQMQPNTENMSKAQIESIEDVDAALAGLDLEMIQDDGEPVEEIIADDMSDLDDLQAVHEPVSADAVLNDDDLQDLDIQVDRAEFYAGQKSTSTGETVSQEAITTPSTTKTERKTKPKSETSPPTPRAPKDLNTIEPKHFKIATGDIADDDLRTKVIALIPKQVKIAEKFENLFQAIAAGKAPSKYTMEAFKALKVKGTLTSAELVAHYKASGLGEGTARSQAGQMMSLFDTLLIANRTGQSLALMPNSAIAEYLTTQLGV